MQHLSNDMYSRLIEAFVVAAYKNCDYLDLVNFNRAIYKEVLSTGEIEGIFKPAYGYGAPDGNYELNKIVKALEEARLGQYRQWLQRKDPAIAGKVLKGGIDLQALATGSGNGTTGVMGTLLRCIYDLESQRLANKPEVILCVPNYSVYDGIVRSIGCDSTYLLTLEENDFLPTAAQLAELYDSGRTMAFVLTYPNNPAQTTFSLESLGELARIIRFCQEKGVHLVVDNIYQDTIWENDVLNAELFAFTGKPDYLYKIFGGSKDRPFFSGLRTGYFIGDPRIAKAYQYFASLANNTHNNHTSIVFAVDLLFRKKLIENTPLSLADIELLDTFLCGWNMKLDSPAILREFESKKLFERYCASVSESNAIQKATLAAVRSYLEALPMIEKVKNGNIGNVLFAKVNPHNHNGDCDSLFVSALEGAGLGILPGNVFGMPSKEKDAWFRITTIHETSEEINRRLERLNRHFSVAPKAAMAEMEEDILKNNN